LSLSNPLALAWLGLAVPIVIFYILKIRLRRVPVSTILFWQQIFEEKQPRSIWQRLRHLLSLLVQLAFLCLLVLALAEPFFKWEILEARRLVLVVDNSASMRATDVAPSRFDRAKQAGERFIDALRFRDEMAIVAAGTQPQVVCGLTSQRRTLHEALDGVSASDGPTRVVEAVALARRLISKQPNGRVIVLTDGCFEGAEKLAANDDVELVAVGARTNNIGLTRFQVRRSLLDPIGYEILAEVFNASDEPVECRLEIELDGDVVDVVPLTLAAGEIWNRVFEKTSAEGGRMTAKLDHDDALVADNLAWALLPRREMQRVTLVSEDNLFLEKVFEANPLVKLSVVKEPPQKPAPGAITVFHRKLPATLPTGPVWVIDPSGSCDLWQLGEKLQNPIVTQQDKDSPLMAHVRLDNVILPEARQITFTGRPKLLASAVEGEPLYAVIERPGGNVLVLTVNLDQGDLPLRTAFPIMATNALAWFAGNRGELRESLATGAITEVALASSLMLYSPDGRPRPLPANVATATIGPLELCGVWRIAPATVPIQPQEDNDEVKQPAALEIACNLANRGESDLRPSEELVTNEEATAVLASFAVRPIWFYLLALALVIVTAEWYLYQRRWIS
jgi:hypothetical protein